MFKLMVVAGPNRGESYSVREGETSIGRQSGNVITLESSRISKRHCTLVVRNEIVTVRDDGSSNGTFVNGELTRKRSLKPGDRISVGEFVFELAASRRKASSQEVQIQMQIGNVIRFPQASRGGNLPAHQSPIGEMPELGGSAVGAVLPPTDLKSKILFQFDQHVMPLFYDLAFKQEWRILLITLFAGLVLANLLVSVSPIIESGKKTAIKEVGKRAQFMARQIVERNTPYLVARTESKTEIGSIEREDGVRVAVLMDLDSRILAPSAKFNQHLVMGGEAKLAAQARDLFRKGKETGVVSLMDGEVVGAVEPVKIYNPHQGKNVIVGMALVSLDASLSTLDVGEMGVIYSETLVYTAIIGGLILLVLYRLTLKPFQVLNDDIDKVLKGEISQVTHEFKIEELNPLWDVINSALQRIPGGDGSAGASGGASAPNPEEFVGPLKMMGEQSPNGVVVCDSDRRVLYANSPFEEMTGIRTDNVVGSPLTEHARDQAFSGLLSDLFDRASSGGDGVTEEFEFSGVQYRCSMAAFGPMGGPARAFVFMAERKEG